MALEDGRDFDRVADVDLLERVTLAVRYPGNRLLGRGVGQFVDVDHFVSGAIDEMADDGGAHESSTTGDKYPHADSAPDKFEEVLPIAVYGHGFSHFSNRGVVYPALLPGNFFKAADLAVLAMLDHTHEL